MIQTAVDDAALVPVAQNGSDPLAHLAFEGPVHRYAELVLQDVPASDERLDRRFEVCGHVAQAHGVAGPIPVIRYPNSPQPSSTMLCSRRCGNVNSSGYQI
jgi:hypothetical protein